MLIAEDIQAEIAVWQRHLGSERRLSPLTLEAYGRDISSSSSSWRIIGAARLISPR